MNDEIQTFDKSLSRLDHLSLRDLAEFFETQADLCRNEAVKNLTNEQERIASGINYLNTIPRVIMRFLKTGCTLKEAISNAANDVNAPIGSVERSWNRFLSDKSVYELRRRNNLIIELACLGFSNSDIGKKVYLHANSVSRIISQARRDYHTARSSDSQRRLLLNGGSIDHSNSDIFAK